MAYGKISDKQREILEYIKKEILNKGYPPTVRDICEAVHLKSTSSVHSHLETLEKNGYIRRDPTKPRAIEIVDDNFNLTRREVVNVPMIGQVAAGQPILAVKNDYENRAHNMAIREEDISNREKRVTVRENNIREEIAIKAEQMIRDRKKSLENEQQNRMVKLESSYRSQTKELQDNYQRMKFVYRSIFYITLFYGMLTTFLMIIRTETIREDFMLFLNMIEKAAKSVYGWSVTAGTFAARLGDMISQPVIATIVHWILLILVVVVIIGGLGVLLALCGKRYIDFFREKQADEISVFVVLTIVALEVFLADAIKSILSINLIWLAMIIFAVYTVIRGVLQVENEKVTKGIIKWTMITAGSLAGIIVMVHFFGGLALVAIPIGIAICANGN